MEFLPMGVRHLHVLCMVGVVSCNFTEIPPFWGKLENGKDYYLLLILMFDFTGLALYNSRKMLTLITMVKYKPEAIFRFPIIFNCSPNFVSEFLHSKSKKHSLWKSHLSCSKHYLFCRPHPFFLYVAIVEIGTGKQVFGPVAPSF